ncbi:MAG: winged helix-turn-helix domain-containing protein, partial [Thermoanaerobaculia bacterium]
MARYSFDHFCLDSDQKLLSRGDEPVRLTPRAFRLLEFLLSQRPKAVSKRDLLQHVWSGDIVEESNLKTLVLEIRTALEERGGHAGLIRTAYGFGYAFAGN